MIRRVRLLRSSGEFWVSIVVLRCGCYFGLFGLHLQAGDMLPYPRLQNLKLSLRLRLPLLQLTAAIGPEGQPCRDAVSVSETYGSRLIPQGLKCRDVLPC